MNEAEIQKVLDGRINYAQCWEDFDVLQKALKVQQGDSVLSICSAGDNSFALALSGASKVVCIDLSAPQLALAQLKWAAIKHLPVDEIYNLLGIHPGGRRVYAYHLIRDKLPDWVRQYWDQHEDVIRLGVLQNGRFEKYLQTFGLKILPWIHNRRTIEHMRELSDLQEQSAFYEKKWNSWRWQGLFRLFFSKKLMAAMGRSTEQFQYVEGPVADAIMARTKKAFTQIPVATNPYMQWILRGYFPNILDAHPYLRPDGIAYLKNANVDMQFVHSGIVEYLQSCEDSSIQAFNFSDIFEYLSEDICQSIFEECVRCGSNASRIAYWNLLAPRSRPESLAQVLHPQKDEAAHLFAQDRAFFYGAFHIDEIHKSSQLE